MGFGGEDHYPNEFALCSDDDDHIFYEFLWFIENGDEKYPGFLWLLTKLEAAQTSPMLQSQAPSRPS